MTGLDLLWMTTGRVETRIGGRRERKGDDRELTLD
jgi:hypothetical protein